MKSIFSKTFSTAKLLVFVQTVLIRHQPAAGLFYFVMGESASRPSTTPTPEAALPGRDEPIKVSNIHAALKTTIVPPFPENMEMAMFGMGCFWGAEKKFWKTENVYSTQVGYAQGYTSNPTYEEVCTGYTGHNEVVRVVFDPKDISYTELLKVFWENHNPTTLNCQGNDQGTQYRSGIYYYSEAQKQEAIHSRNEYEKLLIEKGYESIVTEIQPASTFYYAEDYHQQYLHKNPNGYCGMGGTGVSCPTGIKYKDGKLEL